LTLGATAFFCALATFRATGLGAAFLAFVGLVLTAFFAARTVTAGLRAADFTVLARFALGLAADFALTARFVVFADARFAVDRAVERRKPFVRLLLMCGFSNGCSLVYEQPPKRAELNTACPLNQWIQEFAAASWPWTVAFWPITVNKEKHLKVIVGYVKVRLG
jgi:hypothetical protein